MQFKFALVAAALSTSVASQFVVISVPTPQLTDLSNLQSRIQSLSAAVQSRLGALTSVASSDLSRARSAQTALASFVATAPASLSVPSQITDIAKPTAFTSVPAWYSALPSDLKAYYDQQNSKAQAAVNEVFGVATSGATGGSGATPASTGAPAAKTGAAAQEKVVQYLGMGAAAAFVGVFAL
ncbi:hypothetical protein GQ44DRAFT_822562 [Phaeosphaeriaceae sp. PMI808]|nr:hypothetical protein GQ44DRAFT_822562 [Phaeosphaeriaceae sp. PMI808]